MATEPLPGSTHPLSRRELLQGLAAGVGLLGLTLVGTLFSIYLTWLELFVIQAVCAWCLSSAVIITLLMLLAAIPITRGASRSATPGTSASLS